LKRGTLAVSLPPEGASNVPAPEEKTGSLSPS
jgi:hypothetical protein